MDCVLGFDVSYLVVQAWNSSNVDSQLSLFLFSLRASPWRRQTRELTTTNTRSISVFVRGMLTC